MKLSLEQLTGVCPRLGRAKANEYLPHLNDALEEYGINTERRIECWLAQMAHESMELTRIEENLNYSARRLLAVFPRYFKSLSHAQTIAAGGPVAIASHVYGGRLGNRKGTDDGHRFRGRTPIQLTGRDNYRAAGKALGIDLEADPDAANEPDVMWRVCCWFWKSRGLNALADRGDFREITRKINGGYNGLSDRMNYWARAKRLIDDREPDAPLALLDVDDEDDGEETDSPADVIASEPAASTASPGSPDAAAAAPSGPVDGLAGGAAPSSTVDTINVESGGAVSVGSTPQAAAAVPGGEKDAPAVTANKKGLIGKILTWAGGTTGVGAVVGTIMTGITSVSGLDPRAQIIIVGVFAGLVVLTVLVFGIIGAVAAISDHRQTKAIRANPALQNVK